jgi:hypothetical protein
MTPFEEELKQALRREEPGTDFTARVLARCAGADAKTRAGFWRNVWSVPTWRLGVATAAVALLMLVGGTAYQQHEHEVKGLAAKRQLLLAMHIAGTKLQEVQQRVKESKQVAQ